LAFLWQLKSAIIGIIKNSDLISCASLKENIFIPFLFNLNRPYWFIARTFIKRNKKKSLEGLKTIGFYGGCSLVAEHVVVVRKARVRFSPSTLNTSVRDDNI
jgi:hypothetical protein